MSESASTYGVRLGVDVGSVRVGVAASDASGVLATPVGTLPRQGSIEALVRLIDEYAAVEVVVGLPTSMSGRPGPAAGLARAYADELAAVLAERPKPVEVQLADERLTTVIASRNLSDRGVRGKRQRAVVDQAAAVLILQSWLDMSSKGRGGAHGGQRP